MSGPPRNGALKFSGPRLQNNAVIDSFLESVETASKYHPGTILFVLDSRRGSVLTCLASQTLWHLHRGLFWVHPVRLVEEYISQLKCHLVAEMDKSPSERCARVLQVLMLH